MAKTESVYKEVSAFVSQKIASGVIVHVDWLTTEFLSTKDHIEGEDTPFYTICAQHHIRDIAKACIGKYKPKPQVDETLTLPGFEYLQKAYPVEREGKSLLIPVHFLTDTELEMRAGEYVTMAKGCEAHAKEIRRYIKMRPQEQGAV